MTSIATIDAAAPFPTLHWMHKGKRYEGTSWKALSDAAAALRDKKGMTARGWTNKAIRNEAGEQLAYISYNAKVWLGMEYVADGVCLYDPYEAQREADHEAYAAASIQGVWTRI